MWVIRGVVTIRQCNGLKERINWPSFKWFALPLYWFSWYVVSLQSWEAFEWNYQISKRSKVHTYHGIILSIHTFIHQYNSISDMILCRTPNIVSVFDAKLSLSGFVCYVLSDYCEYHLSDKNNPPATNTDQYNKWALKW